MVTFKGFLTEKHLTNKELDKREEIAKAIEKDNPDMPTDKKMAIATAQAKKVTESTDLNEFTTNAVQAHKILMNHGGRDKNYNSLNYSQKESLDKKAEEQGYKHNSFTGKSRANAYHDHLNRVADTHTDKEGNLKPELKESLSNFYTNNKTGKSGQILSKNNTHTTIKYDNNRTEQVPNDTFEKTHTRIIH